MRHPNFKRFNFNATRYGLFAALLAAPAIGLAAMPGTWTGPYVGGQLGVNFVSSDHTSSERALTGGVFAGYDAQLSQHIVVGGDVFYEWNRSRDHSICAFGVCSSTDYGSHVYGIDGRVGFPLGYNGAIMPYVKVGYGHAKGTGDFDGSDNHIRYGAGVAFSPGPHGLSLSVQYMRADYGDLDGLRNQNLTVGVNYHF